MQKVLITGASGFVGQHLISCLQKNYFLIAATHSSKKINSVKFGTVESIEIENESNIYGLLLKYRPDIVVHLAARSFTWDSSPDEYFKVNLLGTLNLYQSIVKIRSISSFDPKIIYISSAQIYGDSKSRGRINENFPINPINFYGSSKAAADRLSYQYSRSHDIKTVIVRVFNHIGPGQKKGFLVADIASQIGEVKNGEGEIKVGNLNSFRDYLDVRDVVLGYKKIIEAEELPWGDAFNLCSGIAYSSKQILEMLIELSSKKIKVVIDTQKVRINDVQRVVGDNSKFRKTFSWSPSISIKGTLKDVLSFWEKENGCS